MVAEGRLLRAADIFAKQETILLFAGNLYSSGSSKARSDLNLLHGDARPVGEVGQLSLGRRRADIFGGERTALLSQTSAHASASVAMVGADENDCVALTAAVTDQSFGHWETNQAPGVLHPETHLLAGFGTNGGGDSRPAQWSGGESLHDRGDECFALSACDAASLHDAHRLREAAWSEGGDVERKFVGGDEMQGLAHERSLDQSAGLPQCVSICGRVMAWLRVQS